MSVTNFPAPEMALGKRLTDVACPVCGDAAQFRLWIDSNRPMYCPQDPAMATGGPRTITTVEECPINSTEAKARSKAVSEWIKSLSPANQFAGVAV